MTDTEVASLKFHLIADAWEYPDWALFESFSPTTGDAPRRALYVFGNAGKVCGYASKGGKVFIMGDIVDRCWTNSVNDSRTQDLEVMILGSATKYAGESLMGGNFFFGGLNFDNKGNLRLNERPYLGTKMLGGASRGNFVFFDPENRLVAPQYVHGVLREFSAEEW